MKSCACSLAQSTETPQSNVLSSASASRTPIINEQGYLWASFATNLATFCQGTTVVPGSCTPRFEESKSSKGPQNLGAGICQSEAWKRQISFDQPADLAVNFWISICKRMAATHRKYPQICPAQVPPLEFPLRPGNLSRSASDQTVPPSYSLPLKAGPQTTCSSSSSLRLQGVVTLRQAKMKFKLLPLVAPMKQLEAPPWTSRQNCGSCHP